MRIYKTITNLLRASGAYQVDKSTMLKKTSRGMCFLNPVLLHPKDRSFSRSWQRVQVLYLLGTHQKHANGLVFVRSHAYQSLCLKEKRCVTSYSTDACYFWLQAQNYNTCWYVVVRGGTWWNVVVRGGTWW